MPNNLQITRANYVFLGWTATDSESDDSYITEISDTDSGDKTYYAKWAPNTYALTLNENGGTYAESYAEPSEYTCGTALNLPDDTRISRAGYTFLGWTVTDSEDDVNYITEISIGETGDKTYYAKWEPNTYAVTLNENGGTYAESYAEPTDYEYGTILCLPDDTRISRVGYTFLDCDRQRRRRYLYHRNLRWRNGR